MEVQRSMEVLKSQGIDGRTSNVENAILHN